MKLRKGLVQIITMVAILIAGISIATASNATLYSTGSERLLKITDPTYRPVYIEDGWENMYAYMEGIKHADESVYNQSMWKIYEYNKGANGTSTTVKNYANALYCLKGGPGFGSINGSLTQEKSYNVHADMKNPASADVAIIDQYKNNIMATETGYTQQQKYNALIWILDHCYVPAPISGSTQNPEDVQKAEAYKTALFEAAGIPGSYLNDDMIDIVQQTAIWYFTNNDKYKGGYVNGLGEHEGITTLTVKTPSAATYQSVDNEFSPLLNGSRVNLHLNTDIDKLYDYFIKNAILNKDTVPSTTATAPVAFENTTAQAEIDGDYYIAGPYKLNLVNSGVDYDLTYNITEGTTVLNGCSLLNSSKTPVTSIKSLVGSNFYIKFPKTANIDNVKLNVTWSISQNTITYLTIQGSETSEQPVAEVIPEVKTGVLTATVTYTPQVFDLALRKYISKVETAGVTASFENDGTRKPNIDTSSLVNGTTATYKHQKDPIVVETGSKVTYKLNIYNEGNVAGRATKVIDQLPAGVQFLRVVSGNFVSDGTYTTTNNKLTLVRTAGNTTDLAAYANGTLASETIEIECEVTANPDPDSDKIYTNIAWIAAYASNEGTYTDRDSDGNDPTMPASLITIDNGYTNNDTHALSDKDHYFAGQQDDDDFEKVMILGKKFDLALRKFIIAVNNVELKDANNKYTREPNVDFSKLNTMGSDGKVITTAEYKHEKEPVSVKVGDTVTYAIRVYNEGDIDGYASEITDHLPPQLEFILNDDLNNQYLWELDPNDSTLRTVRTKYLAKTEIDPEENLLVKFSGRTLDYKEVLIKCKVKSTSNLDKYITNIADITACTDYNGNIVTDRDSQVKNVVLPSDSNLPDYIGHTSNKSILSDKDYHYKGQEDDDDFEKLVLQEFDLALRKFITKIEDNVITSRIPVVDVSKLRSKQSTTATYTHPKEPLEVETTDIVEYTIRVYNEGDIDGYANVVKDDIPEGLQFLPENQTNIDYRWVMLDKDGNETENVAEAKDIITDYLSIEQERATGRNNLIKAYDSAKDTLDYRDVKVAFKVIAPNTYTGIITNKAQISDDKDENGNDVNDRDSTPDEWIEGEDDQDVEHIKLLYFDLALRKFITAVDDKAVTDRIPVFKVTEDGKYIYDHTKEPVEVENKNVVTYTLRIFNEGTTAGYANVVKDDIPEGLEFLPENQTNIDYRWVMIDKDGNETTDVKNAVSIITDYLSIEQERATGRNNLLNAFDIDTMESPDYRDVKVAFKVTEPNTSDRIIINHAQITDDKDKNGNEVTDIDSTPDEWIEGEDDQDIEKIKVKYFDLALRKWVTQAIVIENGEETVVETGHKAEDDPEEVVKVDLKEKNYKNVVVKFRYSIRITNEGQIAGYCTEISDYIPEGLKFVQEDNPDWKEVDGKIVTDKLKDTLLKPGDSAEVEVLLTWINGKDNFGLKINTAEISKDKNDSDTPDIDSTPNNKKPGEDDIDDAPVLLAVKTGTENVMPVVGTLAVSFAIIGGSAILIKKYVL